MKTKDEVTKQVQALLRKAESTNFGPEAEALVAKAHELMFRWGIEQAELHEAKGDGSSVVIRRVHVSRDGFAPDERAILVHVIAKNSRCRVVISGNEVLVYGYAEDADWVQELYTSLVMQMGLAWAFEEPRQRERYEAEKRLTNARWQVASRISEFCINYFRGYTTRIDERLSAVARESVREMAPEGSSTALVLVKHEKAVEQFVEKEHPHLGTHKVKRVEYNHDANKAGRKAADSADLGQTKLGGNGGGKGIGSRKELR